MRQGVTDSAEIAQRAEADDRLTNDDRGWLYWMFTDPITWNDGGPIVVNSQHRICALRAAGIEPAAEHARRTVEAFWTRVLASRYGRTLATRLAGRLLPAIPGSADG